MIKKRAQDILPNEKIFSELDLLANFNLSRADVSKLLYGTERFRDTGLDVVISRITNDSRYFVNDHRIEATQYYSEAKYKQIISKFSKKYRTDFENSNLYLDKYANTNWNILTLVEAGYHPEHAELEAESFLNKPESSSFFGKKRRITKQYTISNVVRIYLRDNPGTSTGVIIRDIKLITGFNHEYIADAVNKELIKCILI
jgi:hypothetical protein